MLKKIIILIIVCINVAIFCEEDKLFRLPGGYTINQVIKKISDYSINIDLNLYTKKSIINKDKKIQDTQLEIESWLQYISERSNTICSRNEIIKITEDGYSISSQYEIDHIKDKQYDENIHYYIYDISNDNQYISFISVTESLGFNYFVSIFNTHTGNFLKIPFMTDIQFIDNYIVGLLGGWENQQSKIILLKEENNDFEEIDSYLLAAPLALSIHENTTFHAWDLGSAF